MSPLEQLLLQALLSVIGSVVAAVVGYVITRVIARKLRPLFVTAAATSASIEAMKTRTDNLLTALLRDEAQSTDLKNHDHRLDDHERRLEAVEAFARSLSAFAHGDTDAAVPTYTAPVAADPEGADDGDQ